jgi:hypothetical protein
MGRFFGRVQHDCDDVGAGGGVRGRLPRQQSVEACGAGDVGDGWLVLLLREGTGGFRGEGDEDVGTGEGGGGIGWIAGLMFWYPREGTWWRSRLRARS